MTDAVLRVGGDLTELEQALGQVQALFARTNRALSATVSQQAAAAARGYADLSRNTSTAATAQQRLATSVDRANRSVRLLALGLAVSGFRSLTATVNATTASLNRFRPTVFNINRALNGQNNEARSLIGTLGQLAIAYGAIRGLRAAIVNPLQAGADLEALRVQLEGIQGSSARARRSLDWINTFPGRVEGFTDAFKQLQAFGINPLNGSLAKLNDFTAQIGAGQQRLERITRALGQGYAANALRAEELNQLIDAGVPIFQLFSDALGVAAGDVRQLAADGKLGRVEIEKLIDEMGRISEGAALRSLSTLSGILGSLRIEAETFSAAIANSGLQQFVTEQANAFRRLLGEFQESGRLDGLAQRFSNSLESIVRGILALITEVGRGFIELTERGGLENLATSLGGSLEALAIPLGNLVGNLDRVTAGFIALQAGISSVKAGVLVASISALAFGVARLIALVGALGLAGSLNKASAAAALLVRSLGLVGAAVRTVGVATFVSQMVSGAIAMGGLTGAMVAFRTVLLGTLRTIAAFSLAFGGLAIAAGAVYFALREAKQEAERMERVLRETNAASDEYIKTVRELRGAGLNEQADALREISRLWSQGRVETAAFLAEIRRVAGESLEIQSEIQAEQRRISDLNAQQRALNEEKILQAERVRIQLSIEAGQQELSEKKRLLAEAERAEKDSADRILELRRQLAGQSQSLEDRISDIRRRGMSDRRASYRAESEAIRTTLEVSRLVVLARQAETDAERESLLERAKARQQRAEQLAQEVDSVTRQESLARRLSGTQTQLLQEEIALQEDRQTAAQDAQQTLIQQIEEQQQKLKELKTELDNVGKTVTETKIAVEIGEAEDKILELQEKLAELAKGVDVPIRPMVEPTADPAPNNRPWNEYQSFREGFARGGTVRGPSGIDRVPAMLTAGEEVITRQRAMMFRPLLQAINRGSLHEIQRVADRMLSRIGSVPAPPAPAAGGAVPGFRAGGTAEAADYGIITYQVGNRPGRQVFGSYETLRALADDIALLQRGSSR